MPGVLILEALAQASGLLVFKTPSLCPPNESLYLFVGIDKARFKKPVVPGDQLIIACELISLKRSRFGKVRGEATVEGQLVCSGDLMFSLMD